MLITAHERLRRTRRVLSFLSKGEAELQDGANAGCRLLVKRDGATLGVDERLLEELSRQELVHLEAGRITLTVQGRRGVARQVSDGIDAFTIQPVEAERAVIVSAAGPETVTVNASESPLAQLRRRKDKTGRPFLCARSFDAGERLRSDYSRGQIIPRTGMNWSFLGVSGSGGRRGAAYVELNDAALAARGRVELALDAVGPEHAGVLVDVCCFLKGLERVEAERSWPARSAKIVLKSALSALARHYDPPERKDGRKQPMLHWGTDDYRPRIGG